MTRPDDEYRHYEKYHDRKEYALDKLGGKCVECESKEDLHFDHIDPSTKEFTITRGFNKTIEALDAELAKCQLLCKSCHAKKTKTERVVPHGGGKRGRGGCSCILCLNKHAEYERERRYAKKYS